MNHVQSNKRSQQKPLAKGRKGKIHRAPMSILLQGTNAFCARNMGAHVQCTSLECQWYEKRDKKSDSRAAEKGAKKLVSSDFAKILEVATKIRETREKTLFTPPSPIKATNSILSI